MGRFRAPIDAGGVIRYSTVPEMAASKAVKKKPGHKGKAAASAAAADGVTMLSSAVMSRGAGPAGATGSSSAVKATTRRRSAGGRATIKSVAERAGVSIATVSFVLNERPGQVISAPVKKRVHEAARALNYAPSAAAATLARKQTTNVAIVFYGSDHLISNPFYSFVVQGAIKEAAEREYNILFSFMHDEYESVQNLPKVIREKNAEGVLFMQSVSSALVEDIRQRGLAMVAVDCSPRLEGLETVGVDNHRGARLACAHLLDSGHTDVVMLTATSEIPSLKDRRAGFLEELKSRGRNAPAKKLIVNAERLDFSSGYAAAKALLTERPSVTGIFCANDEMAAGVLRAAREVGRSVPVSLSVIGFDDIIMSLYLDPPLSTISFDKEEMGRRAMARLLQQVKAPVGGTHHQMLPVELVLRGSTGQAKKRRAG